MKKFILGLLFMSLIANPVFQAAFAQTIDKDSPYKRKIIAEARFGTGDHKKFLDLAYAIFNRISQKVVGQERAITSLQEKVIQYIESLGTRTRDPVAVHYIGLPGIGKSALTDELKAMGFPMARLDAQNYSSPENASDVLNQLWSISVRSQGKPLILLVDELDKVPELEGDKEVTRPIIGALNQILTDGKLTVNGGEFDFSNIMIVTTMNLSPAEIERFTTVVLGAPKSFYDLTISDFAKFDDWLTHNPSSRYLVLSKLFRTNTVSRLAPNTMIFKPLNEMDYKTIIHKKIEDTLARLTKSGATHKRISGEYSEAFADFLFQNTVFAPSGARETIFKVDALTEQMVNFVTKATDPTDHSLDRPRKFLLDYDPKTKLIHTSVTARMKQGAKWKDANSFTFDAEYDQASRFIKRPTNISIVPPASINWTLAAKSNAVTQKEIVEFRYPKTQKIAEGLAAKLNERLIGQEKITARAENEMNAYLGRTGPAIKEPTFKVIAGFPGIGKSELVNSTGSILNLPIARINLQQYSADSQEAVVNFVFDLQTQIREAKMNSKNGKYILLLEELDKVYEINPQNGAITNRPVMSIIKDLLNSGQIKMQTMPGGISRGVEIDVRDAITEVTMNFGMDLFGFKADPRLTSIDDVMKAYLRLATRPADLKEVLGKIFLPETVGRIIPHFEIMKPLEAADYQKLISLMSKSVNESRLLERGTLRNKGQINLVLTEHYKEYLFRETVIPSEGARYTVQSSQARITRDLEAALKHLPKGSAISKKMIDLTLDYSVGEQAVSASVKLAGNMVALPQEIMRMPVELSFPPLEIEGKIPETRINTAVHEFGHAYAGIRMGLRFEYTTVVPPFTGAGGYVKWQAATGMEARDSIARLYAVLASRAMERIYMSEEPLKASSVLEITGGASKDIEMATEQIWTNLFALGFDPMGGTINRVGPPTGPAQARFADLAQPQVDALGKIMRDMENVMVADFLSANTREWYREKIIQFAKAGGLTEQKFYEMIGYVFPGEHSLFLGNPHHLRDSFTGDLTDLPPQFLAASEFKQGTLAEKTTALENMDKFLTKFQESLRKRLYEELGVVPTCDIILQGK